MKRISFSKDERGAVLPIVVLFIAFIVFGITALVIDVGRLYTERRVLVAAADAGALSGAKEMQRLGSTEAEIRQAAIEAATYNGADESNIIVVVRTGNSINDLEVEVSVRNTVEMFFAKAIGINTSDVPARAVAQPMRLNPAIFPIGVDKTKAYVGAYPKSGLVYLHDSKESPAYFSSLLDLDGKSGNASDINTIIADRYFKLGPGFKMNLATSSMIESAAGWQNLSTFDDLFQDAYNYSTDIKTREAYLTVLAPVYTTVNNHEATIVEFAEIVILDHIKPKNNDTEHLGLTVAFPVTVSGEDVSVDYTHQVGNNNNIFPKQDTKNNADVIVAYFTGTTVSISDVLNGNYQGTLYNQVKFNAVSLVE